MVVAVVLAETLRRMPEFQARRDGTGGRREGRRSLSAYGSHARGARFAVRGARPSAESARGPAHAAPPSVDGAAWALSILLPLLARVRRLSLALPRAAVRETVQTPQPSGSEGAGCMKRKPSIRSLDGVSLEEAVAYLEHAAGDALGAACALAWDRNRLDGSHAPPDDAEVHHALFLLCRARGEHPPSFDQMRVELRRRVAA